jgi:hypothetical protein
MGKLLLSIVFSSSKNMGKSSMIHHGSLLGWVALVILPISHLWPFGTPYDHA